MVNTRNNVIEPHLDDSTKNWVANHVNNVVVTLNKKIDSLIDSIIEIMLQHQYVVIDVNRLKMAEYKEAVLKRFEEANEDPMAELKNLRYKTTIKEYQSEFETL
ncbi:hypothetical protein Tco_1308988 [Tanacetum coccineum]